MRLLTVTGEPTFTSHSEHVGVQQAGIEQFADQEAHAARGMEVVHVALAIRIDPRQQRHAGRKIVEIVPGNVDAGGLGDGDQVNRVIR